MQLEITWLAGRNIPVVFDSTLFPPFYGNMMPSQNRKYREGPIPTTGNMYRELGEIWMCSF